MKSPTIKFCIKENQPFGILQKVKQFIFCFALMFFIFAIAALAQSDFPTPAASPTPDVSPTPNASPTPSLERRFLSNIIKDQYAIWTSPLHLKSKDIRWLAPLGVTTAALIATDRRTAAALDDNDETRLRISRNVSRFGSGYAVGGTAAAFYLIGKTTKNKRVKETGILAAETWINTQIVTQTLKFATQRPRPLVYGGNGKFFTGGNSFPSGHSSSIWSLAAVVDGEYGRKRPIVRIGIYSLATVVSLSRYTGQKHFLSDVLVGGAIGWGIGHFVFSKHHDKSLDSSDEKNKTTKYEKYFPLISPNYNARNKIYGANLTWNF